MYDASGKKIIDFQSGIWCTALGHSHPKINSIMISQINKLIHTHNKLTSNIAETLATNLLELFHFNDDGKTVFLNSGSEAVEFVIRISRLISPDKKILTFSNSYLSAFSSTSIPRDKERWSEIDFLKCSNCTHTECNSECDFLNHIDFTNISTFIFEPAICGRALYPPYKLVSFLKKEVRNHGGIIAVNEITTGFGRTGKWFGYNHYDVEPDIVALGKALGNGYPISAVVMSNTIAHQIVAKNFLYAQSHQNDPLGCVTANEVLNIFKEEHIIDYSISIGNYFMNQLLSLQQNYSCIKDVRGRGLMLVIELNIVNVVEDIAEKMLEKGYFIGVVPQYNLLQFFPALTIAEQDISCMCKELEALLREIDM